MIALKFLKGPLSAVQRGKRKFLAARKLGSIFYFLNNSLSLKVLCTLFPPIDPLQLTPPPKLGNINGRKNT